MRICYVGLDKRTRVAEVNRVKFMTDGFRSTDKRDEVDDLLQGPMIVAHVYRSHGGKRLMMEVGADFDMEAAKKNLLETGWLDLSCCPVKAENLY